MSSRHHIDLFVQTLLRQGCSPSAVPRNDVESSSMQKPWREYDPYEFEPIDLNAISATTQQQILGYSIEFVALGLLHAGDYRLHSGWSMQLSRFFQSPDGAILGWISDRDGRSQYNFASILEDGTLLQSTPAKPAGMWTCSRFPVHVNFGSGAGVEDLYVSHLEKLIDLEQGCGVVTKYDRHQIRDIVLYMQMLIHETRHGRGAPVDALPLPAQATPSMASMV